MKKLSAQSWLKIALGNLVVIALLGFILRYKIAYSLAYIDQKHLLQAHSHFAFSGWISQSLMVLMVNYLSLKGIQQAFEKYALLLFANLISAYGMLLSFPFQGYGFVSITFSTLSIFIAYAFAYTFWMDMRRYHLASISSYWFRAALFFNALSTLGAFTLSFLMANKINHQNWYLAAVYFFLHFQYNGWFLFACGGLWYSKVEAFNLNMKYMKVIFWMLFIACIPCYFLSTLWMKLPPGIYALVIIGALVQVLAVCLLIRSFTHLSHDVKNKLLGLAKNIFLLSFLAFFIKIVLQMFSTIPSLNQYTYGFRPIVIGYLHLVLLGMLSIFLTGYFLSVCRINYSGMLIKGLIIFVSGIILNELMLMLQGITGLTYVPVPYINEALLICALIMFTGLVMINKNIWSRTG